VIVTLNDEESVCEMAETAEATAPRRTALSTSLRAPSTHLGMTLLNFMRAAIGAWKRYPRTVRVYATRKGDVFLGYRDDRRHRASGGLLRKRKRRVARDDADAELGFLVILFPPRRRGPRSGSDGRGDCGPCRD
jgi:hypothetical protein